MSWPVSSPMQRGSVSVALLLPTATPSLRLLSHALSNERLGQATVPMLGVNCVACLFGMALIIATFTAPKRFLVWLWGIIIVIGALGWLCCLSLMSHDALTLLVSRDPETREMLRATYLMVGVFHAMVVGFGVQRMLLERALVFSMLTFLVGNSLVLCLRLGDPTLVRLPLFNVTLPFALGYFLMHAMRLEHTHELRAAEERIHDLEQHAGCLEAARRSALMDQHGKANASPDGHAEPPPSPPAGPPSSVDGSVCGGPPTGASSVAVCPSAMAQPVVRGAAWNAKDGACCSTSMRARGQQILTELSQSSQDTDLAQAFSSALVEQHDRSSPEQHDRQLMPPPPPRLTPPLRNSVSASECA